MADVIIDQFDPAAFFEFLKQRAGDAVRPPARMETHGAWIFLVGDEVWKVKRPVHFPYMDFSTPALRQQACQREIEINQPAAPDIYLGLDQIACEKDGKLSLNVNGDIVDWALHMRRFDQHMLLDALAEKGHLDIRLMPRLATVIHAYHDRAERHREMDSAADAANIIGLNHTAFKDQPDLFDADNIDKLTTGCRSQLRRLGPLLAARQQAGMVRRCHGDLHLRNIVLLNDVPTLFDAIEFDEKIATVDVLNDLAFLLMDLVHRGLFYHANTVLSHYMAREEPDNLNGLALLPLFMSLRAAIRAKVTADLVSIAADPAAKAKAGADAGEYFELAGRFLEGPAPRLVAVGGLSGTGKSTLGRQIAPNLGWPLGALHLRSDLERKAMSGISETERLPAEAYTAKASREVYERLWAKAEIALRAGISVLVDAVHSTADERSALKDIARNAGVRFDGLWLEAPVATLKDRVAGRSGDASDADTAVVEAQLSYDLGDITWRRIDARKSPDKVANEAIRGLGINPA